MSKQSKISKCVQSYKLKKKKNTSYATEKKKIHNKIQEIDSYKEKQMIIMTDDQKKNSLC